MRERIFLGDYKLILFDVDSTLAPSKHNVPEEVCIAIGDLLHRTYVAAISGCSKKQMIAQVLTPLSEHTLHYDNLWFLSESGATILKADDYRCGIKTLSEELLTLEDKVLIWNAFWDSVEYYGSSNLGLVLTSEDQVSDFNASKPGCIAEDRECQITFSMAGQDATLESKLNWNSKHNKSRLDFVKFFNKELKFTRFQARAGGLTSIDVTRKGIDKEYGIRKLSELSKIPLAEMLFIGDQLSNPDGNDYPARKVVECIQVENWRETIEVIEELNKDTCSISRLLPII